ncbi:major facilitator superfamily [Longilinea arvoryzae]|uniref:Major facilitator superfamily n=1 Tax=Longilinea arvoryzae TaxID=360412 RepID=A0A0S7BL00_9CHLR|nr:MFS transporter [Longilinea arvoryzae]GAP14545.1 major facilitator superfamily [Longilinea arvoryzae]
MNIYQRIAGSVELDPVQRKNYRYVQIDGIGVGLAGAASAFLPVFLARMSASSFQIGLLTSMPALTGLILSLPLGSFLQKQRNIVPWFSATRLGVVMCYALTGFASMLLPEKLVVPIVLLIWALATIPQNMLSICFSVVMNAVAGSKGRFDLMTRRWTVLGFTTAVAVFFIGQRLDRIVFPINYQQVFIALSIGGFISYIFSRRIQIPDSIPQPAVKVKSLRENLRAYIDPIKTEKPFVSFVLKRFFYSSGIALATPLFPLYFVREVQLPDSWIAVINTTATAILIVGYLFWSHQSRRHGTRNVLLWATFGLSLYPFMVAITHQPTVITLFAGLSGIFQAGLDLVFFDELMKTVPPEKSAIFVSVGNMFQYLAQIVSPIIGTTLSELIGIGPALMVAALIRMVGFVLFAVGKPTLEKY